MIKVMVFGVFDGLHKGHQFFLKQAKKLGTDLIIVVTIDKVVKELKNKVPRFNLKKRIEDLRQLAITDEIVSGDKKIGSWKIIEKFKPDIIALGYDQKDLALNLEEYLSAVDFPRPKIKFIKSFNPKIYKSSLFQKK